MPREGGLKFVFDVRAADVELATAHLAAAGFAVTDYYNGRRNQRGGAAAGWVRLGAEQPLVLFSAEERSRIERHFSDVMDRATFAHESQGADDWVAGGSS